MFNLFKKKPKEEPKVEPVVEQPQVQVREYTYHAHGLMHKNEDGKMIIPLLKKMAKEYEDEYMGYHHVKKKDFQEDPWMEVSELEDLESMNGELKPCTFEGEPAVKIYIEDYMNDEMHHIGWIPKEDAETVTDMLKKHDCSIEINVEGGKTKTFDGDNIEIEEKPVFVDVKISYEANC